MCLCFRFPCHPSHYGAQYFRIGMAVLPAKRCSCFTFALFPSLIFQFNLPSAGGVLCFDTGEGNPIFSLTFALEKPCYFRAGEWVSIKGHFRANIILKCFFFFLLNFHLYGKYPSSIPSLCCCSLCSAHSVRNTLSWSLLSRPVTHKRHMCYVRE